MLKFNQEEAKQGERESENDEEKSGENALIKKRSFSRSKSLQ